MNRLEFVARRMCASAGVHPDLPSFKHTLMNLPLPGAYAAPHPNTVFPAWVFYIDQAHAACAAGDLHQSLQGREDDELLEVANRDQFSRGKESTDADIELDQLRRK